MMRHLYEITDQYKNIASLLDDPTIPAEAISEALAVVETDLQTKASNCAIMLQSMDSDIEAIKAEETRLKERRQAIAGRRDWLRFYVKSQMEKVKLTQIKTPTHTLAIQNNPPSVEILIEAAIPASYKTVVQTTTIDKKRIADALKKGEEVAGAVLVRGTSLRVR